MEAIRIVGTSSTRTACHPAEVRIPNAHYLPEATHPQLYPSITPVNSFRLVFDEYFNAGLALLPDRTYVFPDLDHMRDLTCQGRGPKGIGHPRVVPARLRVTTRCAGTKSRGS
jgi:hypothetical protein